MYPGEIKFHLLCVSRLWWSLAIKSHMKPYSVVTGLGTELVHWLMKITSKEKQNCRFVSSITKFVHIHSVCVSLVLKLAQVASCQIVKIVIFLWKILTGALPVKEILQKKNHIDLETSCPSLQRWKCKS